MPISYVIDADRTLVTTRWWGAVTDHEVLDHNRMLRADRAFDSHYRQLVDMTGVTELRITTDLINETARDQFFEAGTRRAIVASSDAVFGMARMFALRAESVGQTIEVFRESGPAEAWLGLHSPRKQ
jgi:hypothetical protein